MNTSPQQLTLNVQGMTCGSCAAHVERVFIAVPGVEYASVNLTAKTVVVAGDGLETKQLIAAVEHAGYRASI